MKIKDLLQKAAQNKTGLSLYENENFYSGYIVQIEDDFVEMVCFVYDEKKEQYTHTTKLKIALRRITEVYIGSDNDDLPTLKDYPYSDYQHSYFDQQGLYFTETNKLSIST